MLRTYRKQDQKLSCGLVVWDGAGARPKAPRADSKARTEELSVANCRRDGGGKPITGSDTSTYNRPT